ncbi:MAG: hypothetical protein JJT96_08690 [Opitutales bacterium]|nr:hypothetical protein [Opitutales bacterium]
MKKKIRPLPSFFRYPISAPLAGLCALGVLFALPLGADCEPGVWDADFGVPGASGSVRVFAHQGRTSDNRLIAGGFFSEIGGVSAGRVAQWDGSAWTPLGDGFSSGTVWALSTDSPTFFPVIAGMTSGDRVYGWNGSEWTTLGGGFSNGVVYDFLTADVGDGNRLLAAGSFGSPARVAQYNSSSDSWESIGSGFVNGTVRALAEYGFGNDRAVYAAGSFTTGGGSPANRIARWNGSSWVPVGGSPFENGIIYALAVFDDGTGPHLYAGGSFTVANGSVADRVARWNGSEWEAVEGGFASGTVWSLEVIDDGTGPALYAGGSQPGRISRWNGESGAGWENVGQATSGSVHALAAWGESRADLYFGGLFSSMGGEDASNIARMSGCAPMYRTPSAISAEVDSFTAPGFTGFIISSDEDNPDPEYDRDAIRAQVGATFRRTFGLSASGQFRVAFQVLDSEGNPLPLRGATGPDHRVLTGWRTVSLTLFGGATQSETFSADLRPEGEWPPFGAVRLRATIIRCLEPYDSAFGCGEKIAEQATTGASTILHFANMESDDAALNVRPWLSSVSVQRRHIIDTAEGEEHFRARALFAVYRYDGFAGASDGPDPVDFHFDVTVRDADGTVVPLAEDRVTVTRNIRRWSNGSPRTPSVTSEEAFLDFRPAGQLDSTAGPFTIEVELSHTEHPAAPPAEQELFAGARTSSNNRLLHFNGDLFFDDIRFVITEVESTPVYTGSGGLNSVEVSLDVAESGAFAAKVPNQSLGSGDALTVRLLNTGRAIVMDGSRSVRPTSGDPLEAISDVNGIRFYRAVVQADASGLNIPATFLLLPPGFTFRAEVQESGELRGFAFVLLPGAGPLDENLHPAFDPSETYSPENRAILQEDARPIAYHATSLTWNTSGGFIELGGIEPVYVNEWRYAQLETWAEGEFITPEEARRLSNKGHYRWVVGVSDPMRIYGAGEGTGGIQAQLVYGAGSYQPHFPRTGPVEWNFGGMVIEDGEVTVGNSFLAEVSPIEIEYGQTCPEAACDDDGSRVFNFIPDDGRLNFTADGGLHASGQLSGHDHLQWGSLGGGDFAYNVINAQRGHLHIAGHHARHSESSVTAGEKPALILYAGVDPSALDLYERPGQAAYADGLGDYAGVNLRVPTDASGAAISRIGGENIPFTLTDRSKFYVRERGVTGIYEESPGTFGAPDGELTLYGYDFTFDRYGLNFEFGSNLLSITNGSVTVPFPSDFTQSFAGLTFTCLGAPDSAEPPEGEDDPLPLAYWQASFFTRVINFAQDPANLCGDANAFLTLGLSVPLGALDTTAHGVLGFLPSGNIMTWAEASAENLPGLTSRLPLPPGITLAGPEEETYHLDPVTELYFNDYRAHDGTGAVGFVTFATTTAVPFFKDLQVQVMTSAQADVENAVIYLAGGWPGDGWRDGDLHFFTSSTFDRAHRAFPQGMALDDYRTADEDSDDTYLVRAVQNWLDVVQFNYPLLWSNTLRTFRSQETLNEDLLVVFVNHRVERLSPRNAELIFGATYDGLPQVNLAAIAVSAIDEATGAASALIEAVGENGRGLIDSLGGGIDSAADLLRDRMDVLFGPMLDNALDAVIDPAYAALEDAFNTIQATADNIDELQDEWASERLTILEEFLTGTVGDAEATLVGALTQLDGLVADADGLLGQVDQRLARIQLFIAAMIDEVQLDIDGLPMPNFNPNHEALINEALDALPLPGLLAEIEGERQIIRNFAELLVQQLSPGIADALGAAEEILGELEARLEALLERAEPTIDRIVTVLERADEEVQNVRDLLAEGSAYANEIRGMFASAGSEIETLAGEVRDAIDDFFQTIEDHRPATPVGDFVSQVRSPFDDFDPEEIKERIRQEVRDRFYQTAVIDEVQQFLKAQLYEVDALIQDAVDTALHTINHTIRDFLADAVAELDDTINGVIGPLGDYIGSGDIAGYAHIQGEALRLLRLDGAFEWQVPKELTFQGYLQIRQFDAEGPAAACGPVGEPFNEVEIGAVDVPLGWISDGMRADVMTRFSFETGPFRPTGLAGAFELTGGALDFEAFTIRALGASVAFGTQENYISAATEMEFSDYRLAGGVFFGRTCTLQPIELWDPEVAALLGPPDPTFTGAYVYGEGWIPISEALLGFPASCMFRISAGVGAGAFYFAEGPTYGGRLFAGISGDALCLVSIKGEARLVGVKQGDDFRFSGSGNVAGRAGKCRFCVRFSKTVNLSYSEGSWSVDY